MQNIILGLYVLTTSIGLIAIKLGTSVAMPISYAANRLQFNLNPWAILGILLYGVSFILYIYLLSKFDLGYIIPLTTALVYVLIFVASYFIFKETFTLLKIIGISLIALGVIFLNIK